MKAMNAKCMNGIQIFVCGLLDVDGLRWEDGESRLVFVRYRLMEFNSTFVSPCCRRNASNVSMFQIAIDVNYFQSASSVLL